MIGSPGPITEVFGLKNISGVDGHLVAQLGGVRGVVAADPDHLAARDDRGQQAYGVELVALPGQLDRHRDRVAGQRRDRVGVRSAVVGQLDDAELGVATGGEPGNAHWVSVAVP